MTVTDIVALSSLILAAWAAYSTRKNKKHSQPLDDYKQALDIANAAADSVAALQIEVEKMRGSITKKDKIIFDWAVGIRKLISQMKKAGMTPCWEPEPITLPRSEE